MATVNGKTNHIQHSVLQSTWIMGNADVGTPEQLPRYPNHSVQIGLTGDTFGGATVLVEGSDDGTTWFTLKDVQNNSVSTITNARFDVVDVPANVRPHSSGGSGSTVHVIITSRSFGR